MQRAVEITESGAEVVRQFVHFGSLGEVEWEDVERRTGRSHQIAHVLHVPRESRQDHLRTHRSSSARRCQGDAVLGGNSGDQKSLAGQQS